MQTKAELYILVGTPFPMPFWSPLRSGLSVTWQHFKSCIYTLDTPPLPTLISCRGRNAGVLGLPGSVAASPAATRQDLTWTLMHWCVVISWQASCWLWLSGTRHAGMLLPDINPCILLHWLDLEVVLTFLSMLLWCLRGSLTLEHCFVQGCTSASALKPGKTYKQASPPAAQCDRIPALEDQQTEGSYVFLVTCL